MRVSAGWLSLVRLSWRANVRVVGGAFGATDLEVG